MGLPIVTTSIGAENIDATNQEDWIVTDNINEFADSVIKLIDNEELRITMGINASRYVNSNFTWNVAENKLIEILKKV